MTYNSMYVDTKQYVAINIIAAEEGTTVDTILDRAIEQYVERSGNATAEMALDGAYREEDYEEDYGPLRW